MPQTFVPCTETRNDKTKWMNLLLEKVKSSGSQRTAVILVSRGVTLLMCGFGQLVFVMPQTFVPCTETLNDKTKGIHLLLNRVESPASQRTAVILVSRGVTLPDTLFRHVIDHLRINNPPPSSRTVFFSQPEVMAPPRATLASLQKSVSEILGKLGGGWRKWSRRSVKASRRFRRKQILITRITWACASSYSGRWTISCNGTPARTAGVSLVHSGRMPKTRMRPGGTMPSVGSGF